ncbi:MAG: histone deacetylase family protein [Longimicrobiales bacterium]
MMRIRRVYDDIHAADRSAIEQAQEILRTQFDVHASTVRDLPARLRGELRADLRSILFVAENGRGRVRGFALVHHAPDLEFCFLEFISAAPGRTGGGIGGALYQRVREEAQALDCIGVFMEVQPSDAERVPNPEVRKANVRRLRFYERFGARPIVGTAYETPLEPGGAAPHLLYDDLGHDRPLPRQRARAIVRAILERGYGGICPPEYVDRVVASFQDDPVRIEAPRAAVPLPPGERLPSNHRIPLIINDRHQVHHVRERGYVEAPVRIPRILAELRRTDLFEERPPRHFPDRYLTAVHDARYVSYLRRVCERIGTGKPVYPYVFPVRNKARLPEDLEIRAGYYCIDTFTPLDGNAFLAARRAVDCALTAADAVLEGAWSAYALVRPPGHHAERTAFGGFCYFNSTAAAAELLAERGRVAILDVDYHHGNGQQDIFWHRADVLTASIHGHPRFAYPYFNGFEEEVGEGDSTGANINLPLPENVDGERYHRELRGLLKRIQAFDPRFLVVALGLDPARGDPTGSWSLRAADFEENGRLIGALGLPTVVVQEGGYRTRSLGVNARRFFTGLARAAAAARKAGVGD